AVRVVDGRGQRDRLARLGLGLVRTQRDLGRRRRAPLDVLAVADVLVDLRRPAVETGALRIRILEGERGNTGGVGGTGLRLIVVHVPRVTGRERHREIRNRVPVLVLDRRGE